MYFIFAPLLTSASALPGEVGNPDIVFFHLNTACFLTKKTRNTVENIVIFGKGLVVVVCGVVWAFAAGVDIVG